MKRPTFFISSTIYDFQDLRSALKFYLESQGCKVMASEFNDFQKPLDVHSYDACLQSIHSTDYFILLIGTRIGGWFDEVNRVSITMREYREAYQLQLGGKLKMINFVRGPVWQSREDRRELSRYLETLPMEGSVKKDIANYPSKLMSDAEFISNFITEVGRNRETAAAARGMGRRPTGNWLHPFSTFQDVVDVVNTRVLSTLPVEDMTIRRLLRRELREFLRRCLVKVFDSTPISPKVVVDRFHQENPMRLSDRDEPFFEVRTRSWNQVSSLAVSLLAMQFHPVVLEQAVSLPTFLEFNPERDIYEETDVYEAILRLLSEVRRFNEANQPSTLNLIYTYSKARRPESAVVRIPPKELAMFLRLLDIWVNVTELSLSVVAHLEGDDFNMPELRPNSPILGMPEEIAKETPTDSELDTYLSSRFGMRRSRSESN